MCAAKSVLFNFPLVEIWQRNLHLTKTFEIYLVLIMWTEWILQARKK